MDKIKKERSKKFLPELNLRPEEIENLGAAYVCTFRTESSKSAVQTAGRGYRTEEYPNGLDNDDTQYLSSLIPQERGFTWSISDTYYGNKDKDRKAVTPFVNEINRYDGLLDIIFGIEGLISGRGRHASGVLFTGKDPYEFNAYMKTPSGEVVTQYDLHMAEACGSTKMDILVTEVQDKIIQTIKMLQDDGEIEEELTLREAYNKYLHPDVLPLQDEKIWKAIQEAKILDMFQLDSEVGRQGARKVKPENMIELSSVNGLIRLMTTEKGKETWLERYVRYKNNSAELNKDIDKYYLTDEEKATFNKYVSDTLGIGISQEQLMRALMDKDICGYSLKEANKARKIVSKKKMSEIPNFKEKVYETAKNQNVANYVWDWIVAPGLGYSFSDIHSTSYSFIGFQTAYLATRWNPIYWNTACLIVNSGSLEDNSDEELVDIYEPEASDLADGVTFEDLPDRSGKIRRTSSTDYTKMAKALNSMIKEGINISLVDINKSDFGFRPDAKNNTILFGMKALLNVNDDLVRDIIRNRPYESPKEFLMKVNPKKQSMVSLIKAGAFDKMMDRRTCMGWYIWETCDKKSTVNLRNLNGLMQKNLLPEDTEQRIMARRVYEFNRYLKLKCLSNDKAFYYLDNRAINFINELENADIVHYNNGKPYCYPKDWEKIYQKWMDVFRTWITENKDSILQSFNKAIFSDDWNKYASGTVSSWEMEALCFYYHEHELKNVNNTLYGFKNFFNLNKIPTIEKTYKFGDKTINLFKLEKICGTCISKNKTKGIITLLTVDGVVDVKLSKEVCAMFDKQISEKGPDGKKHVIEKSWFNRGNMIVVQGVRIDDMFIAKKYKSSGGHLLYHIDKINPDGTLELRSTRKQGIIEEDEEV